MRTHGRPVSSLADIEAAMEAAGWIEPVAALPSRATARPVVIVEAQRMRDVPGRGPVMDVKRLTAPRYERPEDIVEAFADRFGAPLKSDEGQA